MVMGLAALVAPVEAHVWIGPVRLRRELADLAETDDLRPEAVDSSMSRTFSTR